MQAPVPLNHYVRSDQLWLAALEVLVLALASAMLSAFAASDHFSIADGRLLVCACTPASARAEKRRGDSGWPGYTHVFTLIPWPVAYSTFVCVQ